MSVFRFALRPDLTRTVRIVLVRQNEIHSLGGLAFIANGDVEFVPSVGLSCERNDQFLSRCLELRGRFVDCYFLYGESRGVEDDFRSAVAKNRERMRDFAEDFFLLEVE